MNTLFGENQINTILFFQIKTIPLTLFSITD